MGGTLFLAFPILIAFAIVVVTVAACGLAMFVAAVVVSIVFAAGTKKRREEGKKLKGKLALPVVLYAISLPILLWFSINYAIPFIDSEISVRYNDCSSAVRNQQPDELQEALQTLTDPLPVDGKDSWEELLRLAVEYGSSECVSVVIDEAKQQQVPLSLDEPLAGYDSQDELSDETPALLLALDSFLYTSPEMVDVLLEQGANPNIVAQQGCDTSIMPGQTPLHLACKGVAGVGVYFDGNPDDTAQIIAETNEVIDLLLSYGANPAAVDADGKTPWDMYVEFVQDFVAEGALTEDEAEEILAERKLTFN